MQSAGRAKADQKPLLYVDQRQIVFSVAAVYAAGVAAYVFQHSLKLLLPLGAQESAIVGNADLKTILRFTPHQRDVEDLSADPSMKHGVFDKRLQNQSGNIRLEGGALHVDGHFELVVIEDFLQHQVIPHVFQLFAQWNVHGGVKVVANHPTEFGDHIRQFGLVVDLGHHLHGLKNVENKVRIDLLLQGPEFRLLKQHLLIEPLVDHLIHLSGHGNDLRSKIVNFIVKGAGITYIVISTGDAGYVAADQRHSPDHGAGSDGKQHQRYQNEQNRPENEHPCLAVGFFQHRPLLRTGQQRHPQFFASGCPCVIGFFGKLNGKQAVSGRGKKLRTGGSRLQCAE